MRSQLAARALELVIGQVRSVVHRLDSLEEKLEAWRDRVAPPKPLSASAAKAAEIFKKVYGQQQVRHAANRVHPFLSRLPRGAQRGR